MTHRTHNRALTAVIVLAAVTAIAAAPAGAFSVKGKIVNGTTGDSEIDVDVSVIDPGGGMTAGRTVRATRGEFTVGDLEDSPSMLFLRIDYKGVRYDYPLRYEGADPVEVELLVYETTGSWEGVAVAVPHFNMTRHDDHLVVECVYEITNGSEPPRTITGEEAQFRFRLPAQTREFNGLYVAAFGIPVEREPIETREHGVFRVDYPIRPGATRVGITYTLPYADGKTVFADSVLYDIGEFVVSTADPGMRITSETNTLIDADKRGAASSYVIKGLARGDEVHLHVAGGGQSARETPRSTVKVIPNRAEPLSLPVTIILFVALLTMAGMAMKERGGQTVQNDKLRQFKNVLLKRLAKLDDLYEAETVSAAVYHAKRTELKSQLASLIYRLGTNTEGDTGPKAGRQDGRKRTNV